MNLGKDYQGMGRYMALGIQMVLTTAIFAAIGYWIDKKTGKSPVFLALFFFIGAGAGFYVVFQAFRDSGAKPK